MHILQHFCSIFGGLCKTRSFENERYFQDFNRKLLYLPLRHIFFAGNSIGLNRETY